MAGALALTCLGRIGDIVLGKVGDCLVAPIQRQFKYLCCFNSNITELQTQFKKLEATKEGVQLRVDGDLRNVRTIAPEVKNWLERANEVTPDEIEEIIKGKAKVKEGCLNGWCPNLKLRYSLSRKAVKKTKDVVDLQADEASYSKPSFSPPPPCLGTIPRGDFTGFDSRSCVLEQIIEALKNDEINLIGVCGMGGVGKTTMVNEASNMAKDFGEVATVVVGQKPDLIDVQARIADTLGLDELRKKEGPEAKAQLLHKRLEQHNKKVLIILDDVWVDFDLQGMGIPLGGANKNFKILYTSRNRFLWHGHGRSKKEIPLELLSEDEAWQLFKEKVGDSVDARDLQPIAKKIVNECGRLPLALALIGGALSKERAIKEIWQDMLDSLTLAPITQVEDLYLRLELSYKYLRTEEAKRLFLLCCLFQEDEEIRIEDLARYGLGVPLFDGINEMGKARGRVLRIVDDLKGRHLLLDGEDKGEECVKVHDVVRDMGISVASKIKFALVIHDEVSEWPKKDTYEDYTCISLISGKITELPKGLKCPDLEFLLLECTELKELPCEFFEGMGKLKVLVVRNFEGILTLPSTLRDLHTLSLPNFNGKFDNASEFGKLLNLKILSFYNSWDMVELAEEIGELGNLRLLDLTNAKVRIPAGVISRLGQLEELNVKGVDWEGNDEEEEGRYASLGELEFLSNLDALEICINSDVIPEFPIFSKLKIYKVLIGSENFDRDSYFDRETHYKIEFLSGICKRVLTVKSSIPIPSNLGGINSLLRSSDFLSLEGEGCNDLVQALLLQDGVDDGFQQLECLSIRRCDAHECLAKSNTVDLPIFPILKVLELQGLVKLTEICSAPIPARSFGDLTSIVVHDCGGLRNLFQLQIVGCLTQLKHLIISSCGAMEEVIWKEQQEDVHVGTNNSIEFPKLEVLRLVKLPSLMGFCRGIDHIVFPQLKELELEGLERFNRLFDNNYNTSSSSEQNDKFGVLSLFHQKVSLPNLKVLKVAKLQNLERLGRGPDLVGLFSKLKVDGVNGLQQKKVLKINECDMPESGCLANTTNSVHFPILDVLELSKLPNLREICSGPLPAGSFGKLKAIEVSRCERLENLFVLPAEECLPCLEKLNVSSCDMMAEVFLKDERGEVHDETNNRIMFPKLKELTLEWLRSLEGFCRGIDQIDFPQLENLTLLSAGPFNRLFDNNCYLSPSSEQHDSVDIISLFPQKRDPVVFQYIQTLQIKYCNSLRYVFTPKMTKSLPQLRELNISSCKMLSRILVEENGLGESSVDEVEFPQLERLTLEDLPKLVSFFPNVHLNTTTLAKSNDHLHNPMQPQPLFNKKVAFPSLECLEVGRLQNVSDLWCSELPTNSFSRLKTVYVKGFPNLRSIFYASMVGSLANLSKLVIEDCSKMEGVVYWEEEIEDGGRRKVEKTLLSQFRELKVELGSPSRNVNTTTLAKSTDHYNNPLRPQAVFNEKVAQLLYESQNLLALGSNGNMTLWKHEWIGLHETYTPRFFPKQRQPANGLAMPSGVTGVNLKDAVPCMALSENHIISACGGEVSLLNRRTLEVVTTFMPPHPASTFIAFHLKEDDIVAIGMEDSTICIFNVRKKKVIKSELKGHEKGITGLAFSAKRNILVSSGADAQLCKWNIDTWEHLKVRIQLPAGKACNGDTRVEFHCNETRLLLSHETQLAIYDASNMDRICQWVPQDVLPAPIFSAAYFCECELVYTSFWDGNIGVFDANSLTLTCLIAPSIYLSPALLSGTQAVYATVVAANPYYSNKFSIGLTNGSVIVMELPYNLRSISNFDSGMLNDRTASSSNINQEEEEKKRADDEVDLDVEEDEEKKKRDEKEKDLYLDEDKED